jgi:prepilin-type N-terminal cleavage/methylation domain-containing protein
MPRYPFSVMRGLARKGRGQAGFSLVELMTVLGVVGIIMAIAAPTISSHIALQEVRGAGRGVVDVLRDARDSAVNEGVPRYVLFDWSKTPREYQMYKFSGGNWVTDGELFRLPSSVTFDAADVTFPAVADAPAGTGKSVPQYAVYFDTRGRYPFEAGAASSYTITLHGGLGRTVTLTVWRNTGQVTGL